MLQVEPCKTVLSESNLGCPCGRIGADHYIAEMNGKEFLLDNASFKTRCFILCQCHPLVKSWHIEYSFRSKPLLRFKWKYYLNSSLWGRTSATCSCTSLLILEQHSNQPIRFEGQFAVFVKFRLTTRVRCFYISVIHLSFLSGFSDKLWVRLGIGIGIWLGLNFLTGMLFQDQQNTMILECV